MSVINTNTKALFSQQALKATGRSLSTAMQQLSTGKRINSAGDDAAGMAISTRMTQQIRALNQSVRNAGDAVSLIQTVEGATNAITDMLQRMRELAIQAVNDTNANDQRSYLDLEFQQLKKEIVRIADMTEWNGFPILNGSAGERVGERADAVGFAFHTIDGDKYWDESACYSFTLEEIERDIEDPSQELSDMCYDAVREILNSDALLTRLRIPEKAWDYMGLSWQRGDKDLYGRFDLRYDGTGPAKLL